VDTATLTAIEGWAYPVVRVSESKNAGEEYSMSVSVIRAKGQVTIPQDVREAAHLEEGDPVEIEITADGILLRPKKLIDASQAWFWSQEWQHGEREASADIKAGRVKTSGSPEAFLESLGD
jgi:AbrB family looped-hinge helix DNA binding protein